MKKESKFYLNLKILSGEFNKPLNEIERILGYPRNSLNNYKNGAEPSAKRLLELSEYFNVSPKYLIGMDKIKNNSECINIEELFKNLNPREKEDLFEFYIKWRASLDN